MQFQNGDLRATPLARAPLGGIEAEDVIILGGLLRTELGVDVRL